MKTELRPTVWRTVRVLANVFRLRFLRAVFEAKGTKNVSDLAKEIGVSVSAASIYLRALNARGLVNVERKGVNVLYGDGKNRSLPEAQLLQSAFAMVFAESKNTEDWAQNQVAMLSAYSHPLRIKMVAELLHGKPVGFMELVERVKAPKATVYRHVSKLLKSAVLGVDEDGRYVLNAPLDSVESALRRLGAKEGGFGFYKNRNCVKTS
jgi:DNA-binding transcriptional ArsR family regulator